MIRKRLSTSYIGILIVLLLLIGCESGAVFVTEENETEQEPTIIASTTTAEQREEMDFSQLATLSGDFAHTLIDELRPLCIEIHGEPNCYPYIHKIGFFSECDYAPVDPGNIWNPEVRVNNGPVWLVHFGDPNGKFTGYANLSIGKWNIEQTAQDLIPCWEEHGYWPLYPPPYKLWPTPDIEDVENK